MPRPLPKTVARRIARVRVFLCDVDGVLTDAAVYVGAGGEFKAFNIQDGLGLQLLQRGGIRVGWVSSRPSTATQQRAEELKIDFLHQGKESKITAVERILGQAGLGWDDLCYAGDDVVDLGVLQRAGVAIAVANAVDDVRAVAHYVTRAEGGHGAVREAAELLLKTQKKWAPLLAEYSQ